MCIYIRFLGLMENFFFFVIVHQFLLTAALSLSFQFLLVLHNNICFYSLSVEQLFIMSFCNLLCCVIFTILDYIIDTFVVVPLGLLFPPKITTCVSSSDYRKSLRNAM